MDGKRKIYRINHSHFTTASAIPHLQLPPTASSPSSEIECCLFRWSFNWDHNSSGLLWLQFVFRLSSQADYLMKEGAGFLRQAISHETESIEEFVEVHQTCLDDIMYFLNHKDYGLSGVASNREKLSSLQVKFENVEKNMDEDTKMATRFDGKNHSSYYRLPWLH